MSKRKVLIITYEWPPMEGVGLIRALKFVKYLPGYGWDPIILTVKSYLNDRSGYAYLQSKHIKVYRTEYKDVIEDFKKFFRIRTLEKRSNHDDNLKQEPRSKTNKLRSFFRELLSIPDPRIGWYKFAVLAGKKIVKKENVDLIFSTSPPETAHLIARRLKKCFNVPWVADLRDPWANNHFRLKSPFPKEIISRYMEKNVLKKADQVITVSEPWAQNLRSSIGNMRNRIRVIENGFDDEDFSHLTMHNRNEKFTISYTGKLHKEHQPIDIFFKILKDLIAENRIDRNRINVKFYVFGYDRPNISRLIESYGLNDVIHEHGKVDYNKSHEIQMSSDVLLLVKWQGKGGEGVYTTKIYDYIGARKPILVVGPEGGIIDELIRRTSSGIIAGDEDSLKKAISVLYGEYIKRGYIKHKGNDQEISKCTRRLQARELANIFNSLVSK